MMRALLLALLLVACDTGGTELVEFWYQPVDSSVPGNRAPNPYAAVCELVDSEWVSFQAVPGDLTTVEVWVKLTYVCPVGVT